MFSIRYLLSPLRRYLSMSVRSVRFGMVEARIPLELAASSRQLRQFVLPRHCKHDERNYTNELPPGYIEKRATDMAVAHMSEIANHGLESEVDGPIEKVRINSNPHPDRRHVAHPQFEPSLRQPGFLTLRISPFGTNDSMEKQKIDARAWVFLSLLARIVDAGIPEAFPNRSTIVERPNGVRIEYKA